MHARKASMKSINGNAILILDDEPELMNIFTLALEQQGFHVVGFTAFLQVIWVLCPLDRNL
jgi:DNA-binding NtrC family response regulator